MGYWRYGSCITIDGDAYIDLNTEVRDRKEDIIKLFTDEEINVVCAICVFLPGNVCS